MQSSIPTGNDVYIDLGVGALTRGSSEGRSPVNVGHVHGEGRVESRDVEINS